MSIVSGSSSGGRARGLGPRGRRFEPCLPDQYQERKHMRVFVVLLKTRSLDHDSGSVDEFQDIVKIYSTPEKAIEFVRGKPRQPKGPYARWFELQSYEVEQ